MTSHLLLFTTIDHLIQRIDMVKVFQEHWRSVATQLAILQHDLRQKHIVDDTRQLRQEIEETLINIDDVIASCTEKDISLNGITYRDLQSLLIRLQIRLAQHQADLTDDYQTKVQILSKAYYEQQILVQKVFDDTMKQRLEAIQQRTKSNTKEKLGLLHQKHATTIEIYLRCCTELHKSVPLTGVNADTVIKIAQTFYQISSEEQIRLEHQWQSCDLPLTRTFIQFKPDKSTSFERNESRRLLIESDSNILQGPRSRKETSKGIWQRLVSAPYMMSMIERDRYEQEEDFTEENIIRTKRWIVILGDPGSGKTSFARWLVHHLAQTLLLNGQHSTDYGPLRIPILIRIGEFAEMLKEQPSLTLFDYIGKHKWMGKIVVDHPSISLNDLSCTLQDYIKHGQALVVLDGLDEIPVSDQRSLIINVVENFVDTYVQTPTGVSAFDNAYLSRLLDDPSRSGGNQLIVTSRIVGYHAAPLAGQFAHYTIRPMDMEHMKDFVDYWFFRVHQQIIDTLDLSVPNQGENHGEALKKELEKTENSGLLDVASNSCLMSFVCSVAFSQMEGSPLPTQRIRLYEAIVNSMLTLWSSKRSTIPTADLIRILSDIATYIHGNSASGLIHEEKMKEICIQSIKNSSNLQNEKNIEEIEHQACEFVRIIREDVGILAARGESLYGFLHLTFQEYFTCLKLINIGKFKPGAIAQEFYLENKIQLIAQSLRRHTNDPRFRVPIALALGKISLSWSRTDFNRFCLVFIQEDDESQALIPLGAYMLISCGKDLVHYPSHDVLFDALDRLMTAAGQHKWTVVCPFLFDHITISLRNLRYDVVSLWIHNFLSRSPAHEIQTISALCHLLEGKPHEFENIKWLNQSSCVLLQSLLVRDNENNNFAIDRLLVKIVFRNHRLLPVSLTTFKEFLLAQEIELSSIPIGLFPLIITLYGGLKRIGQAVVFDPFYIYRDSIVVTDILVRFLSRKNHGNRDTIVINVKQECLNTLLTRIQNHDVSNETVELCIATICLYGIDGMQENANNIPNSLFQTSMNRLKYVSMILRQFYFTTDENDQYIENQTTKAIANVVKRFQYGEISKRQFLYTLNALRSSVARLRSSPVSIVLEGESTPDKRMTLYLPNDLRKEYEFLNHLLSPDIRLYSGRIYSPLLHHFAKLFWISEHNDEYKTQYRMAVAMDSIPDYLLLHSDANILSSLTYVPQHLQNLYLRLLQQGLIMINSKDFTAMNKEHHYFGHILFECLIFLSNASCKKLSLISALIALLPMLRMHQLENFAGSLLWPLAAKYSYYLADFEIVRQHPLNYETGSYIEKLEDFPNVGDMAIEEQTILIQKCIDQEHQGLQDALMNNNEDSMKLYSACISLARVSQWTVDERKSYLLENSVQGAMSINNKLARLDALCIIAFYSHSDYNQIHVNDNRSLQEEIEYQLCDIYPDLPLLLHTTIFIRCLPLLQDQQVINKCLQNLFSKFANADQQDQEVVLEALSPYLQTNPTFSSVLEHLSDQSGNGIRIVNNNKKSSVLMEYLNINTDQNPSSSLLLCNLYLTELASDCHESLATDDLRLFVSRIFSLTNDELSACKLFQFDSHILTVAQALVITNILTSTIASTGSQQSSKLSVMLSNTLHRFNLIEFKARRLLESWLKWKDSNELSSFAYHAALLLAHTDLWSVESATIVCDLLCCENDRFRQRAEMILRSKTNDNIRTGSTLGIDVLLTLAMKRAHFQHTSPSANLTLLRFFENTFIDIQAHLEVFLRLERYRIHAVLNNEYSLHGSSQLSILHVISYFSTDNLINVSFCDNICKVSNDLIQYLYNLIASNFSSFLEIDGDTTSNAVLESHTKFVVSVFILLGTLFNNESEIRPLIINALITFIRSSTNDEVCHAAAHALSYICDQNTHQILFKTIPMIVDNKVSETSNFSDHVLCALISSYSYSAYRFSIDFNQNDLDLFRKLLKHSSPNVVKAVHVGLARVLKNNPLLLEMLDSDCIQCYHALMGSTAYMFLYETAEDSANIAAEFIEKHPDLLPIFVVELYNSIRHLTHVVLYARTMDYCLAYGYPQYVEVAGLIATRMPATFCAFIKNWRDGDNLKRALFYSSKQHNYQQRASCLTILSMFGELTVELCEMFIEALHDDPHIQSTCYKCLTRINAIKDEKIVLNMLFCYLQSKSVNVRYIAAKMLLHLSQSSLISFNQVRTVLNDLLLDPHSNEELWLIEEPTNMFAECIYYHIGSLKDVIYSLLIQQLTGDASRTIRQNVFNDVDMNFVESEKASRLASCRYEKKVEENTEVNIPSTTKVID